MKLAKRLLSVVGVVVIVAVLALVVAGFYVDTLARKGIEYGGTYALGVPTTVKSADVGVLSGTFGMNGLRVGNARGYPAPHFLTLDTAKVAVGLTTLSKPVVELPELRLETIDVRLEKKDGKANYAVILDHLASVTGGSGKPREPTKGPAKGPEKKFVIRQLTIRRVTVHVDWLGDSGSTVGDLTKVTVPLDEISLKNVGKTGEGVAGSGVTLSDLTRIIVQAVLGAAAEKAGDILPADIRRDLGEALAQLPQIADLGMSVAADAKVTVEKVGAEVGEALKGAGEKAKEGLDEAKKQIEGVGDRIKGILPGG